MKAPYDTDQEAFWAGEFGDEYAKRNRSPELLRSNVAFFAQILRRIPSIRSIIEFGANIGLNLEALHSLHPQLDLHAVEINEEAVRELRTCEYIQVYEDSILKFVSPRLYDLAFTKGVLIHIDPESLELVYDILYRSSSRYILLAEYYNPNPISIPYRGHTDRLYKRDFAGDMLDRFSHLDLLDYGFLYRRDPRFPQDDITWFLMEKRE